MDDLLPITMVYASYYNDNMIFSVPKTTNYTLPISGDAKVQLLRNTILLSEAINMERDGNTRVVSTVAKHVMFIVLLGTLLYDT
jgi:hypothetical protein